MTRQKHTAPRDRVGARPSHQVRQKQAHDPALRNKDFDKRLKKITGRKVIPEKGIRIDELAPTSVPAKVQRLEWEGFIRDRNKYHLPTVYEFYATMIDEQFRRTGIVHVQGRPVEITKRLINEHYDLADYEFDDAFPEEPAFLHRDRPEELPTDLRTNGNPTWVSKVNEIGVDELRPEERFWNIFCCYSMVPTSRRSDIIPLRAKVLYCIKHNLPIDMGQLIKWEILQNGRTCERVIFPSLITHFCVQAGVIAYRTGPGWHDGENSMGYRQWNIAGGIPRLLPGGGQPEQAEEGDDNEEEEQDADVDGEDDADFVPPADQFAQILQLQQQLLQGQQQMREQHQQFQDQMIRHQLQVTSRLDAQDQRLHQLETRIIEEFDIRLQQFEHQGNFQYIPRPHKQAGGSSSSQAPPPQ